MPAEHERSADLRRHPVFVVFVVTAAQMATAMTNAVLPTIAPKVAESLGIEPAWVGYQVSLFFAAAMVGTAYGGGWIARFGPARAMQFTLCGCIAGALMFMLPHPVFIVLGSLVAGFGTGFINASGAQILVSYTPASHRNLVFSLKQTGMPLGGMVVSLTAPALALAFGWQWALVPMIVLALAALLLNQHARALWDRNRDPRAPLAGQVLGALPLLWRDPALRWLALAGMCFSAVQRMLLTYLVLYLVTDRGYGLVAAGVLLSVTQAAGFVARPVWGWIADRSRGGMRVLLLIGIITTTGVFALIHVPEWPGALYLVCATLGLSSVGWNGLYYAENTRLAGPERAGAVIGGASFFVYAGVLAGPALFAAAYGAAGSYTQTLYSVAAISIVSLLALGIAFRRAAGRAPVYA
jgi:predicted MFS family arabinose efflux permease